MAQLVVVGRGSQVLDPPCEFIPSSGKLAGPAPNRVTP